jgi:FkbM family methyltransferase
VSEAGEPLKVERRDMTSIVIRPEPIVQDGEHQVVAARIEGVTDKPYRLWYRVPGGHAIDEVAISHAFVVSVINQAMAVGRDIAIDLPMPRGLAQNIDEYQNVWCTWEPDVFRRIRLRPSAFIDDEPFRADRGAIMSFSGGLDSSFTAKQLAENNELAAIVAIWGLDIPLADDKRWAATLSRIGNMPRSLGRPLLSASTNWNELAYGGVGYLGYLAPTLAVPILLSRHYGYLVVPSGYTYDRLIPHETGPLTDPLLGRPGFPIRHYGAWARRIHKVAAIASWPEALQNLRPCDVTQPDGSACGKCRKCIQTALTFAGLGLPVPPALGGNIPPVEDLEKFDITAYATIAMQDALAAAKQRGATDPWVAQIERRLVTTFDRALAERREADELRRRLDYVLGGTARRWFPRMVRRAIRALRNRTGPPELPRWWFQSRPLVPALVAHIPQCAISSRGRRLYVDREDRRAASLIESHGDLYPTTQRMWRSLLASQPWTHIIDVGANYGEMVIDMDIASGTRVMAVEPNPTIRRHLERSLREAKLPITVVPKVVSDHEGVIGFMIDQTWSGLSSVRLHPQEAAGHRVEAIQVEATTLAALLDDGVADRDKRVLIKIDVEGHEPAVLRGLGGAPANFADFAAVVEIRHLATEELAVIMQSFTVELFDEQSGALVAAPDGSPDRLRELLQSGRFYGQDAVLRRRPK